MSLDDRDWWREARKEKEELYGGDFSLHSKPIHKKKTTAKESYITETRKCPHCKRKSNINIPKRIRFKSQSFYWTCPYCHQQVKSAFTWSKIFWLCVFGAVTVLLLYLIPQMYF